MYEDAWNRAVSCGEFMTREQLYLQYTNGFAIELLNMIIMPLVAAATAAREGLTFTGKGSL